MTPPNNNGQAGVYEGVAFGAGSPLSYGSMGARTHDVETEDELDALVDWDDDGSGFARALLGQ